MSNESTNELVVKPAPHITGTMSKNRLMQYTFTALLIITVVTAILWWPVMCPTDAQITGLQITNVWQLPLGSLVLINALIAVGVAVGVDALMHKFVSDSELNTWSSAVFGLIVTLSFTLGIPAMAQGTDIMPIDTLTAPIAFVYVALISLIGLVVFKKIQGVAGRKFVNPAAAAKFLVLLPFIGSVFLRQRPLCLGHLRRLRCTSPCRSTGRRNCSRRKQRFRLIPYLPTIMLSQTQLVQQLLDLSQLMILEKFHGWTGGASSLAVIVVGIALFVIARKYIKWKVTAAYFVSIAIMSIIMSLAYADTDLSIRLLFEVFIGSSIFLGFFMATDPATTPFTGTGQIIFGVGLGILTILIQTYMNFFGGSLLALLIMNLTVPLLDRVGIHKPFGR